MWGHERNRREPERSVVILFACACKWLINKGMLDYKVSAGARTLNIQRTPPLPFMGVQAAHVESCSNRYFQSCLVLVLHVLYGGVLIINASACGIGGTGGGFVSSVILAAYASGRGWGALRSFLSPVGLYGAQEGLCHA